MDGGAEGGTGKGNHDRIDHRKHDGGLQDQGHAAADHGTEIGLPCAFGVNEILHACGAVSFLTPA